MRLDRDFKFNPLRPFPQMRAKNWMQVLADVFCQPAELLSGSKAFALGELDELFMECPKPGPTMFDFLESVKEKMKKLRPSSVRGRYAERLATRLESVTSIFRDVYDCAVGFSMEDLIHENVVFETDGIETLAAQFQILCLLFANYHWRMETGRRGDDARQLIVIDEGQSVFSPFEEKKFASGIPFIDLMVQRAAEFGMVFMVCNQNTRLAYAIKENSPIKVCFNLCDGHDQGSIARTMSLDEEQRAELAALQVGEAVVQVGGRCPKPIKVRVDHFPLEKTVTNEEVAAHIRAWLKRMEAHVVPLARRRAQGEEEREVDGRLAWEEEALLRDVHHVPGIDWRGRTERLRRTHGMSADAARKARERLERRGLVEAVRVKKAAKRGSSFVGLVLTGKGREYLRGCGVRVGKAGRGDARHRFWVDATKAFYERRGHRCEIEADLTPSVSVDLLVCGEDGHRTGVEVELSAGTVVRNIRKLLPLGLERVVIAADGVALLDEVRSKAEKELGAAALRDVEFVLA
ncbi:MAG: hypothetical protein ACE5O2_17215, partial [Armatimonadota bacterium]